MNVLLYRIYNCNTKNFNMLNVSDGEATGLEILLTGKKEYKRVNFYAYREILIVSLFIIVLCSTVFIKLLKKPTTETSVIKSSPRLQVLNLTTLLSIASLGIIRHVFQVNTKITSYNKLSNSDNLFANIPLIDPIFSSTELPPPIPLLDLIGLKVF